MSITRAACRTLPLLALGVTCLAGLPGPAGALAVPGSPPVFTTPLNITNSFHPFVPGGVKVYTGHKGPGANVVVDLFLTDTRSFQFNSATVDCRVLQETEFLDGELDEISHNYFAQADDGSLYYFGEVVDIYVNGAITSHEGSWLVGGPTLPSDPVDTATATTPGLFMPPAPALGDTFKPEDLAPVVDETDTIIQVNKTLKVKAGKFTGCIEVEETSTLDSDKEQKVYAPGVGVIHAKAQGEALALIATTIKP